MCSMVGGACECEVLGRPTPLSGSGTYTVDDDEFVDTSDGSRSGFCVRGDEMTMTNESMIDGEPVQLSLQLKRR